MKPINFSLVRLLQYKKEGRRVGVPGGRRFPERVGNKIHNVNFVQYGLKKIEKRFPEAIEKYTAAIELNPTIAAYYTNRAFCHLKLESYGYAIT